MPAEAIDMTTTPPKVRRKHLFFGVFVSVVLALGFAAARALPASAEATTLSISVPSTPLPTGTQLSYVAPTGSDTNPGTLAAPWRTIQRGLNALGSAKTLVVRGGRYPEMAVASLGGTS